MKTLGHVKSTVFVLLAGVMLTTHVLSQAPPATPPPHEAKLGLAHKIVFWNVQKTDAYFGDGDHISAPPGAMSSLLILSGGLYRAGTISSNTDGKELLLVGIACTNASATTQTFHPLEIELVAETAGVLVAAGIGDNLFAKDAATWNRLRTTVTLSAEPGNWYDSVLYAFGVSKDTSVWKVMYHDIQLAELSRKKM